TAGSVVRVLIGELIGPCGEPTDPTVDAERDRFSRLSREPAFPALTENFRVLWRRLEPSGHSALLLARLSKSLTGPTQWLTPARREKLLSSAHRRVLIGHDHLQQA